MVKEKKEKYLIEKTISIILMAELLCSIISNMFNIHSNANIIILAIEMLLLVIYFFTKKTKFSVSLNLEKTIFLFFIFILYAITIYKFGLSHYNLMYFCFYFIIPFFVASHDVKCEKILFYCMIISLLSIPVFEKLFTAEFYGLEQMSMGNAYALCVPVVAGILHFTYYFNKKYIFLYLFELYILIRLLTFGNRGVLLEILLPIILVRFSLYDRSNQKRKLTLNYIIKCSVISLICLLVVLNLNIIIKIMYDFFNNVLNINIASLKKTTILLENDDLSNGRLKIYSYAIDLIKNKPLLGYGIRSFGVITRESWPHNIFIQLIFEGGLVLGLFPIILFVKNIISIIRQNDDKNAFIIHLFLLLMVIPRFLFSNDIWLIPYVWLFFGYSLRNNKFKNRGD